MALKNLTYAIAAFIFLTLPALRSAGQVHPSASPFKGEYFCTHNEDSVCAPFTRNLNQFRQIDFDVCHPRLSEKYPQFTRPEWEEIPFDLGLAETIIMNLARRPTGQGDPFWTEWLKASEPLRVAGKITLGRSQIDVDGDGVPETILRLFNPLDTQYRGGYVSWTIAPDACSYRYSILYMLDTPNDSMKKAFNISAYTITDIFHFSGGRAFPRNTNGFYGVDGRLTLASRPDIGATRGTKVHLLSIWGVSEVCSIDWVPTGHYRPPRNSRTPR